MIGRNWSLLWRDIWRACDLSCYVMRQMSAQAGRIGFGIHDDAQFEAEGWVFRSSQILLRQYLPSDICEVTPVRGHQICRPLRISHGRRRLFRFLPLDLFFCLPSAIIKQQVPGLRIEFFLTRQEYCHQIFLLLVLSVDGLERLLKGGVLLFRPGQPQRYDLTLFVDIHLQWGIISSLVFSCVLWKIFT